MKCLLWCLCFVTSPAVAGSLTYHELSENLIVAVSQPFSANSLLVRTPEGKVILVDTPTAPSDTQELVDWVAAKWGERPAYAFNSHWHYDASGGNQVLRAYGAEVIASRRTADLLRTQGLDFRARLLGYAKGDETKNKLRSIRPTLPSMIINVETRVDLQLGGEDVAMIYPGPSHSVDSIGVYFPRLKVLYGGCTVRSDGQIINRNEADFAGWAKAIKVFAELKPEVVIPGHGKRYDAAMLAETRDVVAMMRGKKKGM